MSFEGEEDVEGQFGTRVDGWVASAVGDRDLSFSSLLERLPGVYPATACASVARLARTGRLRTALADSLLNESAISSLPPRITPSLLPVPHPLDFEWRFTVDTCLDLLEMALSLCRKQAEILLFGTPTIALAAMSHPAPRAVAFWGDKNRVTDRVIALNEAMKSPIQASIANLAPTQVAGVVVVDPPWYLDYIRPMFTAANAACELNGHVIASLPPEGAMANATSNREATIKFAHHIGLELVREVPLSARYETPFFEQNSLAACGISPPPQWRRGDVLVFRKFAHTMLTVRPGMVSQSAWSDVQMDRVRVFIKRGRSNSAGSQGIIPILQDDVLPSVSRRDSRRHNASIWTSGNRIFASDNINLVLEAALSYDAGRGGRISQRSLLGHGADKQALDRVSAMLSDIVLLETSEEQGLVDTIAMARRRAWTSESSNYLRESTTTTSG